MNRRTVLGWLTGAAAAPAAIARAITTPAMKALGVGALDLDLILEQLYAIKRTREAAPLMETVWLQTTRFVALYTLEYEDAIDLAMSPPGDEAGIRFRWHERRKERCRERLAKLRKQRPLPLP